MRVSEMSTYELLCVIEGTFDGAPEHNWIEAMRELAKRMVTVIQELRRELAISMRVCGNWREFPGAPAEEEPKDWKYALRCIEKLKLAESKLREFEVEWDGEKYVFAPKSTEEAEH
jgi:hypothetical protein